MLNRDWGVYGVAARAGLGWIGPVIAFAVIAALCVWAKWDPVSPQPTKAKAKAECSYAQQPGNGKHDMRPTIIFCVQPASDAKNENAEGYNNYRAGVIPAIRHWINRTIADPVAGFTALLFLITVCLWSTTERTLAHGRESTHRELRAYVFAIGDLKGDPNGGTTVTFAIHNSGKTPAYNVRIAVGTDWDTLPEPKNLPDIVMLDTGSRGSIGPGQSVHTTINVPDASPEEWAAIQARKATAYVYGSVTYNDAFGSSQTTWFRHYVGAVNDHQWSLVTHHGGNNAT